MALANRWVTTRQLGFLLGFMGSKVLGQYDLALLTAEATPGKLLFVEENIRATATALDVPIEPFRSWIALHETTHAFEFEAHPWLRPYLADRLERQLKLFGKEASGLGREALRSLGRAIRGEGDGVEHWMERLMTPEQRTLFRETTTSWTRSGRISSRVSNGSARSSTSGATPDARRSSGQSCA